MSEGDDITTQGIVRFGTVVLDRARRELVDAGRPVEVEPKAFDLLALLVANRDRMISKRELLDTLWPNEVVTDGVLTRCIWAARTAVGDSGRQQGVIKTFHRRGYRFVASVRESEESSGVEWAAAERPGPSVFVGRRTEMQSLRDALADALSGKGRLVFIAGEPGIGKTRAIQELASIGRAGGARVRVGRCQEERGAPSLWPWVQILRAEVAALSPERLRELTREGALASLALRIPQLSPPTGASKPTPLHAPGDADEALFLLFDAIVELLRERSREQPLLLMLEDVHAADSSSLRLLRFLAKPLAESHVLLVATYRDVAVDDGHPLATVLEELAGEPGVGRIELRGLASPEVAELVGAIAQEAGRPAESSLCDTIGRLTAGNPFFVLAIARLLADDGKLGDPGALLEPELPQSVSEAIACRLALLSQECQRVLQVAATVGRDFDSLLLESVTGLDARKVLAQLDEAERRQVVQRVRGSARHYRFTHELFHRALSEAVPRRARVKFHEAIGEALEGRSPLDQAGHLATMAHHFFEASAAGKREKAIEYALAAARASTSVYDLEERVGHYERALELLEVEVTPDHALSCEVLLELGLSRWRLGRAEKGAEAFEQCAGLARSMGRTDLLAQAALLFAATYPMPPTGERCAALLEEVLRAPEVDHDPALRARLMASLAVRNFDRPIEVREALTAEALELARQSGDPEALVLALVHRSGHLASVDRAQEGLVLYDEMISYEIDPYQSFLSRLWEIRVLVSLGQAGDADRKLRLLNNDVLARSPGMRVHHAFCLSGKAIMEGNFDEAERQLDVWSEHAARTSEPIFPDGYAVQRVWMAWERGQFAALLTSKDALFDRFSYRDTAMTCVLVYMMAELGELDEARAGLAQLPKVAELERGEEWTQLIAYLAEASAYLDDDELAQETYQLLEPITQCYVVHAGTGQCPGSTAHFLGVTAAQLRHFDVAERHFVAALELEESFGARPAYTRTQMCLARMLLARGRPGDHRRAREHLEKAHATAEKLGLGILPQINVLRDQCG